MNQQNIIKTTVITVLNSENSHKLDNLDQDTEILIIPCLFRVSSIKPINNLPYGLKYIIIEGSYSTKIYSDLFPKMPFGCLLVQLPQEYMVEKTARRGEYTSHNLLNCHNSEVVPGLKEYIKNIDSMDFNIITNDHMFEEIYFKITKTKFELIKQDKRNWLKDLKNPKHK